MLQTHDVPFVDVAGSRIYYRRWDVPTPTATVLFAHGFGEHTDLYHRLAFALAGRGIETWALELPGHGRSSGPRGLVPVERAVEAIGQVRELIREAHPGAVVIAAGHSLGAVLMGLAVVRRPDRFDRLLLSAPPLDGVLLDVVLHLLEGPAPSTDAFYLDQLATDPFEFDAEAVLPDLHATITGPLPELRAGLPGLSMRVGIISGSLDPFFAPAANQRWASSLHDGRSLVLEGSRHDVINDARHREVEAAVAAFALDGSLPAGSG